MYICMIDMLTSIQYMAVGENLWYPGMRKPPIVYFKGQHGAFSGVPPAGFDPLGHTFRLVQPTIKPLKKRYTRRVGSVFQTVHPEWWQLMYIAWACASERWKPLKKRYKTTRKPFKYIKNRKHHPKPWGFSPTWTAWCHPGDRELGAPPLMQMLVMLRRLDACEAGRGVWWFLCLFMAVYSGWAPTNGSFR